MAECKIPDEEIKAQKAKKAAAGDGDGANE